MLDAIVICYCSLTRITGWRFKAWDRQPRVYQANKTHAKKTLGNHQVFNAGKPQLKLSDANDLKKALINMGVL